VDVGHNIKNRDMAADKDKSDNNSSKTESKQKARPKTTSSVKTFNRKVKGDKKKD
jgi:hypothetical protein